MSKPMANPPTVLVTDAGRGSALSIIRSLGRSGWRVFAADSDSGSLGFRSRYAHERLRYPAPETAPRDMVSALLWAVQRWEIDLIIPVTDATILPLSEARTRFSGYCTLALPDGAALDVAIDKRKTIALAERLGVPVPRTCLVHSVREALDHVDMLGWPIVLKPQVSRLYRDQAAIEAFTVCYANDLDDLTQHMQRFAGRCPVLLQSYYRGVGHGVELLLHQGRPLAAFQHRRLREIPVNGGASAFRESVPLDPILYRHALLMLEALRWTGLAMVEFKVGADGPQLMEINGRVWGSLPLAVQSGMDFPRRLAALYMHGPPPDHVPPDTCYRIGVHAHNLELDILWIASVLRGKRRYPFLAMPSRGQGIAALLSLLNPTTTFDILSIDDPRPGIAELVKIARKLRRKAREAA